MKLPLIADNVCGHFQPEQNVGSLVVSAKKQQDKFVAKKIVLKSRQGI